MAELVLVAKSTYVWLAQLSRDYGREISRLDQIPEIVIGRRPGRAGIDAIDVLEDLRGRGMPVMFPQKCHHGVALRSTPQAAGLQQAPDLPRVRHIFRINLK